MSDVKYPEIHEFDGAEFVRSSDYDRDFDRVTAERDALRTKLAERESELEEFSIEMTLAISDSQIRSAMTVIGRSRFLQLLQAYNSRINAALNTAEAPRNQCDGCQAGIPVVSGAHRMGKTGGYPDTMSCTAKIYKPAEGGGDEIS